jgi:maleate isomerase
MPLMTNSNAEIGTSLQDEEIGWKARLGVINPSAGITFDHEWARILPKGVSFHVTRLLLERATAAALDAMAARAPEAAYLLKTSRVNALCYGCTLGSLHRGRPGEQELANKLSEAASAPAIMMADSAVQALEGRGFEIAVIETVSIPESWNITKLKSQDVFDLATRALRKAGKVDALFLSCGNMRTIDVIERIEAETGVPTISSNQAMLWKALQTVGVNGPLPGFGRLLGRT